VEYGIEKPNNKLLAVTELDSDTWVGEVKRIRDKKLPLTAAGVHALRAEYPPPRLTPCDPYERDPKPIVLRRTVSGNELRGNGPFFISSERADTKEAIGLNRSCLRSTRPVILHAAPRTSLTPASRPAVNGGCSPSS
jgi:hypothetical protein